MFDQNHGLTPQEISNLAGRKIILIFYSLERLVFCPEHHQKFFLSYLLHEKKNGKNLKI